MALNFNDLPASRPAGGSSNDILFEAGKYPGIVKGATITTGPSGEYLVVRSTLLNPQGQETTIFDKLFYNNDKPLPRYKVAQFLRAINVMPQGDFEMKDLVKVLPGRKFIAAIKVEQNPGYSPRNEVDVFDDDIFYPIGEATTAAPAPSVPSASPVDDDDCPFTMDGEGEAEGY